VRARIEKRTLYGPLFDEETDLLALAEEILDVGQTLINSKAGDHLADRLIMLDIARSLRLLVDAPGVQSYHGKYGSQSHSTLPRPRWRQPPGRR